MGVGGGGGGGGGEGGAVEGVRASLNVSVLPSQLIIADPGVEGW